jgi:hypothetical protein
VYTYTCNLVVLEEPLIKKQLSLGSVDLICMGRSSGRPWILSIKVIYMRLVTIKTLIFLWDNYYQIPICGIARRLIEACKFQALWIR